jgi:uncharacterized protein (DUF2252 family)
VPDRPWLEIGAAGPSPDEAIGMSESQGVVRGGAESGPGGKPRARRPAEPAYLSLQDLVARGKDARREAPRSSHGKWAAAANRADPIALLEEQAESRIPELISIRHGRMLISPFTFYRGNALIMAGDLAATPRSGLNVQSCGDAHLSNFGLFASPERELLFDVNDFDETLPGPWEWDVKRLAASFEVMGRDRGFAPDARREIVTAAVRAYREVMRQSAAMGHLDAWYAQTQAGQLTEWIQQEVRDNRLSKKEAKRAGEDIAKARTRDSARVFARRAKTIGGELQIVAEPPLIERVADLVRPGTVWEDTAKTIQQLLNAYRRTLADQQHPVQRYRYVDAARKVVGVGSVGTRCYILLMLGRDDEDPLFLQVKEAQASVLERYVGTSVHANHGQRVVVGQRLMQAASDLFLGWLRIKGLDGRTRDYYVRQLHDWKGSAEVDRMLVPGATFYAQLCGATLARAHARWGDRIEIAAYLGNGDVFEQAIADFAIAYADQNERDFDAFAAAVRTGRLAAETGL